jgi:hypothetical protein
MGIVLANFPLMYGFIIVQIYIYIYTPTFYFRKFCMIMPASLVTAWSYMHCQAMVQVNYITQYRSLWDLYNLGPAALGV